MTWHGEGGIVRHGVNSVLEGEADELIRKSLEGVTSMEAKRDILTPWKQKDRLDREVYSSAGVPDESTRKGMYHRAWNSEQQHLNSRDGLARGSRFAGLQRFVDEHSHEGAVGIGAVLGDAGFDQ